MAKAVDMLSGLDWNIEIRGLRLRWCICGWLVYFSGQNVLNGDKLSIQSRDSFGSIAHYCVRDWVCVTHHGCPFIQISTGFVRQTHMVPAEFRNAMRRVNAIVYRGAALCTRSRRRSSSACDTCEKQLKLPYPWHVVGKAREQVGSIASMNAIRI